MGTCDEVIAWIMKLDKGRFKMYGNVLQRHVKEEEVHGQHIGVVDAADLKRWGVTKFADIKYLQNAIRKLVNHQPPKNEQQGIACAAVSGMYDEGENVGI